MSDLRKHRSGGGGPPVSRGSAAADAPPYWTGNPAENRLARMLIGAADEKDLEHLVMVLNRGGDPQSVRIALAPLRDRIPERDRVVLDRLLGGSSIVPYLAWELGGGAQQAQRRRELAERLAAEAHDQWERAAETHTRPRRAIRIQCAGDAGKCKKERGLAWTNPGVGRGDAILILTSGGPSPDAPTLRYEVPPTFAGQIPLFSYDCRHNLDPDTDDVFPYLDLGLLEPCYLRFVAAGSIQVLKWAPDRASGGRPRTSPIR